MTNRALLTNLLTLGVVLPVAAADSGAKEKNKNFTKRPNVILIMADDLGWGDVGFNGNKIIKTPNMDALASEGVRFDRFYSACAVSSPTRASVLTGRNPYRTGVFNANVGILRQEEVTIPELLKEEGYSSGHFGKWHLGTLTATTVDANRGKPGNEKELNPPKLHGYDDAFVTESKVPTWDPMVRPANLKNFANGWNYIKEGEPTVEYGTFYWDIDGNKVTDNLDGDDSKIIMDRTLPFIDKQVASETNFLAVVWFHTPHKPCVAGPEYAAMYKEYDDEFQNYAGCITAMDEQIGRLVKHLEELGVDENTMIWFCSDNGPENNGPGLTGGFRERKRSLYEGGVRVPGFMVWRGEVKEPMDTNFPAGTSDYFPTIASAVGVKKSKIPYELDGIDLIPMLKGKDKEREEPIVTCYTNQISFTTSKDKIYCKGAKATYINLSTDPQEKNEEEISLDNPLSIMMINTLERYKKSFEGAEYGTKSSEMMNQKWSDPLAASKK